MPVRLYILRILPAKSEAEMPGQLESVPADLKFKRNTKSTRFSARGGSARA